MHKNEKSIEKQCSFCFYLTEIQTLYKGIPFRGQRWLWCVQKLSCKGKWNIRTFRIWLLIFINPQMVTWSLFTEVELIILIKGYSNCINWWCCLTFSVSPCYINTLNCLSSFYFDDLQETAEQCCTLSTGVRNHFESIQIMKGYKKCKSGHRQSLVSLVRYVYHHYHHH